MSDEDNRHAVIAFLDALATGDGEGLAALIHPDVVPPPMFARPGMPGPEAARTGLMRLHEFFSDVRIDIDELLADGDRVAVRFRLSGRHTGEFFGVSATGRDVVMEEALFYRLRDGRVIGWWALFDLMGTMRQLGAILPEDGVALSP